MKPRLIIRPPVVRDLEAHAVYIGEQSPASADRFLDAAMRDFDGLAQMPGKGRIRRPSFSGVLLSGSGEESVATADRISSTVTRARLAKPGTDPSTTPSASAMASMAIQTSTVVCGSHQTELVTIDEYNFV